jgi:uncharacterized RDD family membrane protein YckC
MNQNYLPENPYAAPAAAVADEVPRAQALADRGTRLAAVLLDGLFIGLAMVPMIFVLVSTAGRDASSSMGAAQVAGVAIAAVLVLGLLVWNCILLERGGQTIAKKLFGIKVVRRDGSHCGLARIFLARYLPVTLLGAIPFIGSLVSLVDALLIFRDDRRCLHDEIADTIVVTA